MSALSIFPFSTTHSFPWFGVQMTNTHLAPRKTPHSFNLFASRIMQSSTNQNPPSAGPFPLHTSARSIYIIGSNFDRVCHVRCLDQIMLNDRCSGPSPSASTIAKVLDISVKDDGTHDAVHQELPKCVLFRWIIRDCPLKLHKSILIQ